MFDASSRGGGSGPSEFASASSQSRVDLGPLFARLLAGGTLSAHETGLAFEAMVTGQAHDAEMGALLGLLATRTPTSDELLGAARVMRAHVDRVPTAIDPDRLIDTAGTGGAPKTFNVSTVAAVIAAAAGAPGVAGRTGVPKIPGVAVAKHGNRSRTGRGSAEVLQLLGVNVDAGRVVQARCLEHAGICFCFAIHHHPATRHVMATRKALGFATIFNLLGPLTNPAGAKRQVMGVYEARFVRPIAEALLSLGATRAIVAHGHDGLDEISIAAPTLLAHVEHGRVREEEIAPEQFGFQRADGTDLAARDLNDAADIFASIIENRLQGPRRDMAMLNAGATLLVGGVAETLMHGVELASEAVADGRARTTLSRLIDMSREA